MMTEQEARETWCPMARIALREGDGPSNRGWSDYNDPDASPDANYADLSPKACRCIASKCAAWRWRDPAVKDVPLMDRKEAVELGMREDGDVPTMPKPFPNRRGFCGLAGTPE